MTHERIGQRRPYYISSSIVVFIIGIITQKVISWLNRPTLPTHIYHGIYLVRFAACRPHHAARGACVHAYIYRLYIAVCTALHAMPTS